MLMCGSAELLTSVKNVRRWPRPRCQLCRSLRRRQIVNYALSHVVPLVTLLVSIVAVYR